MNGSWSEPQKGRLIQLPYITHMWLFLQIQGSFKGKQGGSFKGSLGGWYKTCLEFRVDMTTRTIWLFLWIGGRFCRCPDGKFPIIWVPCSGRGFSETPRPTWPLCIRILGSLTPWILEHLTAGCPRRNPTHAGPLCRYMMVNLGFKAAMS